MHASLTFVGKIIRQGNAVYPANDYQSCNYLLNLGDSKLPRSKYCEFLPKEMEYSINKLLDLAVPEYFNLRNTLPLSYSTQTNRDKLC
jgi:hypothetical protein